MCDVGYLLEDLHLDGAAFRNLWLDAQGQANVLALDGLEGVFNGRALVDLAERPGNERDVLSDNNFRLLVVHGEDIRRGQDVGVTLSFQRLGQGAEVVNFRTVRQGNGAVDKPQAQARAGRQRVGQCRLQTRPGFKIG